MEAQRPRPQPPTSTGPRLALLGAFPFPLPQGSQVYFEEQARALGAAGCTCTLITYGRGVGPPPADLEVVTAPSAAAPRRMRSGPSLGKPLADAALLRTLLSACERVRFDAVLAHNAEAAAIALAARRRTGVPVVYVVHTLLGVELSAYLPGVVTPLANTLGARIDRALARRADALVVLAESARQVLEPRARGPVALLPPGLEPGCAPARTDVDAACRRHGLEPDGFVLYTGNLDGYQEIELLSAAAAKRGADAAPIVVATHGAVAARAGAGARSGSEGLRTVTVRSFEEMRALTFGARTLVLMRRRVGGFPIKLLNYMEAARPIVAFAPVAEGLVHRESAWLLAAGERADDLARALGALDGDPALRARLGQGAKRRLAAAHEPRALACETKRLVESIAQPG